MDVTPTNGESSSERVLMVRDWEHLHETADSRKLRSLSWLAVPVNQSDPSYAMLMARQDGVQILGGYHALLMMASQCPRRGTFADRMGHPYDLATIAAVCRLPLDVVTTSVELLTTTVPWLEWADLRSPDVSGESPGTSGESPGTPGSAGKKPGLHGQQQQELQDRTAATAAQTDCVAAAAAEVSGEEWETTRPIANRLLAACWPETSLSRLAERRRGWLARMAVFAVRHPDLFAPVWDALARDTPRRPEGFVSTILADVCRDRSMSLDAELSRIVVSDSLLAAPQEAAA